MELMNVTKIMDKAVDILRKYIKTIIMFTIGYGIILTALIFVVAIIMAIGFMGSIEQSFSTIPNNNSYGVIIMIIIISLIFISVFYSLYVGMIKISSQEFIKQDIYAMDAIKISFKNIFKTMGIVSIVTTMFLPIIFIISYTIYISDKNFKYIYIDSEFSITGIIIWLLLMLIIVILISIYNSIILLALNALIVEEIGVFKSIKRSCKLINNNFMKILGCIILFNLTTQVIKLSLDSFFALILSVIYMVTHFLNMKIDYNEMILIYTILIRVGNIISWFLIFPLSSFMMSFLYFNERFKSEGYDIQLKLREIDKNYRGERNSEVVECNTNI